MQLLESYNANCHFLKHKQPDLYYEFFEMDIVELMDVLLVITQAIRMVK